VKVKAKEGEDGENGEVVDTGVMRTARPLTRVVPAVATALTLEDGEEEEVDENTKEEEEKGEDVVRVNLEAEASIGIFKQEMRGIFVILMM